MIRATVSDTTVPRAARKPYSPAELTADRSVHIFGLLAGGLGSAALIGFAWQRLQPSEWWPILVYTTCLSAMLGCSAAYNLNRGGPRREILRRLDHAAIFLMIAGTYTPFTALLLPRTWAVLMTGSVWMLAILGVIAELRYPRWVARVDLALYLGLGWVIIVAWKPLVAVIDSETAALIISGGILYTIGAGFHIWRALKFQNAIWHGFVLIAAGCHYTAIIHGLLTAADVV